MISAALALEDSTPTSSCTTCLSFLVIASSCAVVVDSSMESGGRSGVISVWWALSARSPRKHSGEKRPSWREGESSEGTDSSTACVFDFLMTLDFREGVLLPWLGERAR